MQMQQAHYLGIVREGPAAIQLANEARQLHRRSVDLLSGQVVGMPPDKGLE
jgi:hypothetical protein